jgi:hypothetical protein
VKAVSDFGFAHRFITFFSVLAITSTHIIYSIISVAMNILAPPIKVRLMWHLLACITYVIRDMTLLSGSKLLKLKGVNDDAISFNAVTLAKVELLSGE